MLFLFKGQLQRLKLSPPKMLLLIAIGISVGMAIAPSTRATERPLTLKEKIELGQFPPTYSDETLLGIPLDLALPQPDAIIPLGQSTEYAPGNPNGKYPENFMHEDFIPATPELQREEVPTEE
jgi:hypothetical protein